MTPLEEDTIMDKKNEIEAKRWHCAHIAVSSMEHFNHTYLNPGTCIYNHSLGTALSDHVLSLSHASQSDRVVGSKPMPLTFQIPRANMSMLHRMYTILTRIRRPEVPGVSNGANARCMPRTAKMGDLKSVKTMKMEKIWSVLPVMYMPVLN